MDSCDEDESGGYPGSRAMSALVCERIDFGIESRRSDIACPYRAECIWARMPPSLLDDLVGIFAAALSAAPPNPEHPRVCRDVLWQSPEWK